MSISVFFIKIDVSPLLISFIVCMFRETCLNWNSLRGLKELFGFGKCSDYTGSKCIKIDMIKTSYRIWFGQVTSLFRVQFKQFYCTCCLWLPCIFRCNTYLGIEESVESSLVGLEAWAIAVATRSRRNDRGVGGLDSHFIVIDSSFTAESSRLYCCTRYNNIFINHLENNDRNYSPYNNDVQEIEIFFH